jgi:trigger factor
MMMTDMRDGGVSDEEIQRQINPDNFLKYKEIVKGDIVRDFKISMATDEIARLEGIDVPDYQVEEQMEVIREDAAGAEDFDENMIRSKVKTTLVRQAVMDWLAERAQLKVEYLGAEPELDEALLEQIAAETLERERAMTAKAEGTVVDVESE